MNPDSTDPSPETETPPGDGAPPPAAEKVIESNVNESDAAEIVRLKRDLEDERGGRKKEQTRLSELEDENRRLKEPVPVPVKQKAAVEKKGFLDGATFFG